VQVNHQDLHVKRQVAKISVVIDSRLNNTEVPDSRKMRRDVQIARTREKGNVNIVLVAKPEGKKNLEDLVPQRRL
jgi:hypothetical protein